MNNQDPRFKKNYFSNMTADQTKDAYQRYSDQKVIPTTTIQPANKSEKITIATWYIEDMDAIKIKRSEDYYASKIRAVDVMIIHGITDDIAFGNMMKFTFNKSYKLSKPVNGTMNAIVYDKMNLVNTSNINISSIPTVFNMQINNHTIEMISFNVKNPDARSELTLLEKNISYSKNDIIILGNLNIGCGRYKDRTNFGNWTWLIPDNTSTKSDGSGCSDDNIIISPRLKSSFLNHYTMEDVNALQSSHYMVYAVFNQSSL